MFIPLYDANSLKYIKLQYVTLALIALNVTNSQCTCDESSRRDEENVEVR